MRMTYVLERRSGEHGWPKLGLVSQDRQARVSSKGRNENKRTS